MHENGKRLAGIAAAAAAASLGLFASVAPAGDGPGHDVERTRNALAELAETQRLISQERRQWSVSRQLLNDRIDVVQREIDALRAKVDEARANIADADQKRDELMRRDEELQAGTQGLRATLADLEARTKALLRRFPEPLLDIVRPLSQRLPQDPSASTQSLSERFLSVVGILKYANKFQRDVSVGSEVHTLPDGTSTEVTAMYVGLGCAFYANAKGTVGAVGAAGADGWVWTPSDAARDIARAIAIQRNEEAAAFVQLPVRVE